MASKIIISAVAALAAASAVSAQTAWGQCGGKGWSGSTSCPSGYACTYSNDYYSQCIPGTASSTSTRSTSSSSTSSTAGGTGGGGGGSPTSTSSAPGSTPTLMSGGYAFIRAVEDPNFHKYLQSEVLGTASDGVLGSPMTAAQFQVTNGQVVQYVTATSSLYLHVAPPTDSSDKKLKTTWATTPDTLGTFAWSGDTLQWSSTTVSRPALNAWLVCPDSAGHLDLYINLGPYSYQTPAGCADETIHAYTGPYPTS